MLRNIITSTKRWIFVVLFVFPQPLHGQQGGLADTNNKLLVGHGLGQKHDGGSIQDAERDVSNGAQVSSFRESKEATLESEIIGGAVGAVIGAVAFHAIGCSFSDTDCGIHVEALLIGAALGGILGAGIASGID